MMPDQYTVSFKTKQGVRYLCSIETHCYGERILGFFDVARSCAMPLTYDQAVQIRNMLRDTAPAHDLQVVRVPWYLPESEVQK